MPYTELSCRYGEAWLIRRDDYSDERQKAFCAYCGGVTETWDHIPPKVFLNRPLPNNLPKIPACEECNNGSSQAEQYLACLIECTLAGSSRWEDIKRNHIALTLKRDRRIKSQMDNARQPMLDGSSWFRVEDSRIRAVILKLARGHAAYELATPLLEAPESVVMTTFVQMGAQSRRVFESTPEVSVLPEVGSRAMYLLIENGSGRRVDQPWIVVQSDNYRYVAVVNYTHLIVRLVIREYLACEVVWRTA